MVPETQSNKNDLAELQKHFGSPPILSTESVEDYEAVAAQFMKYINPEDFIVLMFVRDLTDWTWEMMRYKRHKTWAIERKHRQQLEFQAMREQFNAQQKARARKAKDLSRPVTVADQAYELEIVVESTADDVKELVEQRPKELDLARALESSIDYYERLDQLLGIANSRRNGALELIAFYRDGLASRLRRISNEIIDGEFSETNQVAPPLVPSTE